MLAQLWSISGLATELERDRKALAKSLEGLEPDSEETDSAGRITRRYRMSRVFAHLRGGSDELDGNAERARKDKESADKLALENAVTRGELGVISEIGDWFGTHIDRCCARLEQIPDALGQFCEPRVAAIIIPECRRLIHEARAELAADAFEGGAAHHGAVDTATHGNGQPVGGLESAPVERKQRRARTVAN